jgi:hypothetical protein
MRHVLVGVAVLLTACGGESHVPPVVRDSVGIRIVENFGPSWTKATRWRLEDTPSLNMRDRTDPNYTFSRVIGSTKLQNGSIVVADGRTQELRWFDESGRFQKAVGRGSFASIEWIGRLDSNTAAVFDFGNLRLSTFGPDGELKQTANLVVTFQASPSSVKGIFADSSFLAVRDVRSWAPTMIRAGEVPDGLVRGPAAAFRYDINGTFMNILGSYQGAERIFNHSRTRIVRVTSRPFGRTAVFAVSDDRYYVGEQNKFEVEVHDPNGVLTAIVRFAKENAPVTAEDVDRYKRSRLAGVHELQKTDRQIELDALPFPETMPAYGTIIADSEGNLWIADYRPFGDEQARWTVFDSELRMLGIVETPSNLTVHDIGSDYVLGVFAEEDNQVSVRLYGLVKPTGRG